MSDQVETMMYTGSSKPWWMAGSKTMDTAKGRYGGMEAVTSAEAIELSGLGKFRVEKREAGYYSPHRKVWVPADGDRFLVRTDTGAALGRCKESYQEYQPSEAFSFLDGLAAEGALKYHTAGILDGGKKVWLLAQTPFSYDVKRRSGKLDRHHSFLMSSLDFTGAGSNIMAPTDVRVVCANTERMARDGAPVVFRVPHRGDMHAKYEAAADALAEMHGMQQRQQDELQSLADSPMDMKEFIGFATATFLKIDDIQKEIVDTKVAQWFAESSKRSHSMLENKVAKTTQLFMRGIGNEGDSKADALNAFTEYFDHDHVAETKKKVNAAKEAARGAKALTSSFEGHGAEVKHRVRQRLLATV